MMRPMINNVRQGHTKPVSHLKLLPKRFVNLQHTDKRA